MARSTLHKVLSSKSGLSQFLREGIFPTRVQHLADPFEFRPVQTPVFRSLSSAPVAPAAAPTVMPGRYVAPEPELARYVPPIATPMPVVQPATVAVARSIVPPRTVAPAAVVPPAAPVQLQVNPVMAELSMTADWPIGLRLKAMQWQRRQQNLLSKVNALQPSGCHVIAWNILPLETFAGDEGRFLMMACDYYSHCFDNTMFLPAMPAGEAHLKIMRHPLVSSPEHKAAALQQVSLLRERVAQEHNRVLAAIAKGDLTAVYRRKEKQQDYKNELSRISRSIATLILGVSTVRNHDAQFGSVLKEA